MLVITFRIISSFSKWSKPLPKADKNKQIKKSFAVGDDKAAKLSKSEQQLQNKQKVMQQQKIQKQTLRKIAIMRTHDASLEQFKTKHELDSIKYYQQLYLGGGASGKTAPVPQEQKQYQLAQNFEYIPSQPAQYDSATGKFKKYQPTYGNYTVEINSRFPKFEQFPGRYGLRRMGTLGVKLGMTTLWDRWGDMVPATVIQLDRCQVVQIKPPPVGNPFYFVQMGLGQRRIKSMNKAEIGHFMKAGVPPKRQLHEFTVSKECLFPVGYMMSARHYTPGMFVDISGKTVGHGFTGTIKRWGFHRQPQTHGNSLTTRVLGSTGQRQDPGRVFKNKKMYGRYGNTISVQKGMPIFRIDVIKNIIYIKGSVPGKAGTVLKISDTLIPEKAQKNLQLSHFPTFVEQPGVKYAKMFSMYCGERDPDEIEISDNAFILDDGDDSSMDDAPAKDTIPEQ